MDKKKIKIIAISVPLILAISALSGCVAPDAFRTRHWDHLNTEGTAVTLYGYLLLGENFHNWDAYFIYDTERHDDWENYKYRIEADSYDAWNGFSVDIYDLDRTTEYHYRALGEHKTQGSTIRVGVDLTFIPGAPRVIVNPVSFIGVDNAIIHGELLHMGGASSCDVYLKYGTDLNNLNMETPVEVMTSTGQFSANITGLSPCETYFYRAVAENDAATWVSNEFFNPWFAYSFFIPGMPVVETFLPWEVTETSAKFRGTIFGLGGTPTCDVWFEYGDQSPNQLDETTSSITVDVTGEFSIDVTGLTPDTTYWVRTVGNNDVCEHKGEIKEFRTLGPLGPETNSENTETDSDEREVERPLIRLIKTKYPWLENYIDQYPILKKIFG